MCQEALPLLHLGGAKFAQLPTTHIDFDPLQVTLGIFDHCWGWQGS